MTWNQTAMLAVLIVLALWGYALFMLRFMYYEWLRDTQKRKC